MLGKGNSDGAQRVVISEDSYMELFFQYVDGLAIGNGLLPTKDAGPLYKGSRGVAGLAVNSADMSGAVADVTSAPSSGQLLVIDDIFISTDTALRVDFTRESSSDVLLRVYLAANSAIQITLRNPIRLTTVDKKLQARTSVAGNISILTSYHSEQS